MKSHSKLIACAALSAAAIAAFTAQSATDNVVEEVAWMIGDTPIWKSEVEEAYISMMQDRVNIPGDPYCYLPEQIAIERLYLHQAELDTVEAPASRVSSEVESRLNYFTDQLGSREKVEEYFHKSLPELRSWLTEMVGNQYRVNMVQQKLTEHVKSTPAMVRRYFNSLPQDSVPFVPMQVEVQIITVKPNIPRQEIEDVKDRLRGYAERVNSGQTSFATLARLYSEDGSAQYGGELGFRGRGQFVPEFAAVAFNLNDPTKVSKVVETEYGYHIIQLIEKRGDRVNVRHILLKPKPTAEALTAATQKLDTLRSDILRDNIPFGEVTQWVSTDKDTRNNQGIMINSEKGMGPGSTLFEMKDLPAEVARAVAPLQVGDISRPFVMRNSGNDEVVAIVRLTKRIDAHRANAIDDYQLIREMYENSERERILREWVDKKIADTYIRIEDGWRNCDFRHNWLKN